MARRVSRAIPEYRFPRSPSPAPSPVMAPPHAHKAAPHLAPSPLWCTHGARCTVACAYWVRRLGMAGEKERVSPSRGATHPPSTDTTRMSGAAAHTTTGSARACRPIGVYRARHPERSVLHAVVREHLETWLARTREAHPDEDPIPRYVEDDFRRYLTCGLLSEGFGRARCRACGHDFLVAFSCSKRGVCPSCTTRHMADDCRDAGGRAMQE